MYYFVDQKYIHLVDYSSETRFLLFVVIEVISVWLFSLIVDNTIGKLLDKTLCWTERKCLPLVENFRLRYQNNSRL